jgi:penicillin-binding protein 1A
MASTQKRSFRKYIVYFWLVFLIGLVTVTGVLYATSLGWLGPLPPFEDLENPKSSLASEVYSSDGALLGKYYYEENRSNSTYEELSPYLIDALIATEDIRFYEHSGIDTRGLLRVLIRTVILGQDAGGGSTISQQLAKNLFHKRPSTKTERVKQKLIEWIVAVQLEH